MAEAALKWKVQTLREINAAPAGAQWMPTPGTAEADWFRDMKLDGYVEGTYGRVVEDMEKHLASVRKGDFAKLETGPEVFMGLHVTEKGKKLVEDYDAKNTWHGIWKRHHVAIWLWLFTILSALLIRYLTSLYFP